MKKAPLVFGFALLAVTGVAAAADPPPPIAPSTSTPEARPEPSNVTTTTTQSTVTPAPVATPPVPAVPSSTTTVTSADTTAPPPSAPPESHDTTTLNQSIRPNRPLLFTGGLIFAGAYATTAALTAANTDGGGDKNMYIPVVGPWLHLADSGNHEGTTDTLLVAGSGVLQGAGLGMAIASLFVPEKIPAATIQAGNVKMNVAATSFGRSSAGIGAVGEF